QAQEKQAEKGRVESAVEKTQESTSEPVSDFVITIQLKQVTRNEAVKIAYNLKERFGENLTLNPLLKS
ncbi:TPA: hypothetical protein QB650_002358, partial [Pasteurella multocida]|nr:hypothetical protein [Pasteurella multocida]